MLLNCTEQRFLDFWYQFECLHVNGMTLEYGYQVLQSVIPQAKKSMALHLYNQNLDQSFHVCKQPKICQTFFNHHICNKVVQLNQGEKYLVQKCRNALIARKLPLLCINSITTWQLFKNGDESCIPSNQVKAQPRSAFFSPSWPLS